MNLNLIAYGLRKIADGLIDEETPAPVQTLPPQEPAPAPEPEAQPSLGPAFNLYQDTAPEPARCSKEDVIALFQNISQQFSQTEVGPKIVKILEDIGGAGRLSEISDPVTLGKIYAKVKEVFNV